MWKTQNITSAVCLSQEKLREAVADRERQWRQLSATFVEQLAAMEVRTALGRCITRGVEAFTAFATILLPSLPDTGHGKWR